MNHFDNDSTNIKNLQVLLPQLGTFHLLPLIIDNVHFILTFLIFIECYNVPSGIEKQNFHCLMEVLKQLLKMTSKKMKVHI